MGMNFNHGMPGMMQGAMMSSGVPT